MVELFAEMDRYYGTADPPSPGDTARGIERELFGPDPSARALLAWVEGGLAGMAICSLLWPAAGIDRSLYLKELYVLAAHRGSGTGTALLDGVVALARELGCHRVEWTANTDDAAALRFYARRGVAAHPTKAFFRLEV